MELAIESIDWDLIIGCFCSRPTWFGKQGSVSLLFHSFQTRQLDHIWKTDKRRLRGEIYLDWCDLIMSTQIDWVSQLRTRILLQKSPSSRLQVTYVLTRKDLKPSGAIDMILKMVSRNERESFAPLGYPSTVFFLSNQMLNWLGNGGLRPRCCCAHASRATKVFCFLLDWVLSGLSMPPSPNDGRVPMEG